MLANVVEVWVVTQPRGVPESQIDSAVHVIECWVRVTGDRGSIVPPVVCPIYRRHSSTADLAVNSVVIAERSWGRGRRGHCNFKLPAYANALA